MRASQYLEFNSSPIFRLLLHTGCCINCVTEKEINLILVNAPYIYLQSVSDGYEPPDWVNDSVLDTMCFISDFIMLLKYNTKKKNRLSAGGCDLTSGCDGMGVAILLSWMI